MANKLTLSDATKKVSALYREAFGRTPLVKRMSILLDEALELKFARDMDEMMDEAGDLLSCLLALCSEMHWDPEDILQQNLDKIARRVKNGQYAKLGRKIRVCLIGGAFDPPHLGHRQLGELLLSIGEFDEVWYVPANRHMHGKQMIDASHRLQMCNLAFAGNSRFRVFDYEIVHDLAGETYNFLNRLLDDPEYKDDYSFWYGIELDNANHFDTWVNFEQLKELIPFIVVARQGVDPDPKVDWYRHGRHRFLQAEVYICDASSSNIRKMIIEHPHPSSYNSKGHVTELHWLFDWLGMLVYNYVVDNKLYTKEKTT